MAQVTGDYKVEIYDSYGRLVRNILNSNVLQDIKLSWNGDDNKGNMLPSGVYHIVMFNAERELESLKVVKK
ncbi:MAG: T9SS type A sorting domain-containing protein [Chlorobi bacterium]|nr:T9SS type A sorting domain-containing protein [Chlorobiota bacterium]